MSNIYPQQTRQIDPFSSYNSNIVNALTRMITNGENCIYSSHAIDVTLDSTSPLTTVVVGTGRCFKDDVIINIDEEFRVDLEDGHFYLTMSPFNEAGYYLLVLDYSYVKALPAPEASIKILKPSQYSAFTSQYLFLKAINVVFNGATFEISGLEDYLPSDPSICRKFTQAYVGLEYTLPEWTIQDNGRLIYVVDQNELFYGTLSGWENFSGIKDSVDTSECSIGQLGYVSSTGKVLAAISTARSTFADCVVMTIGGGISGRVRLYGRVADVGVESGITLTTGDKLFLSKTEAGKVTNQIPEPYKQSVGVCIDSTGSSCEIWFMPTGSGFGYYEDNDVDIYQDLLLDSIFKRLTTDPFINDDYIDSPTTAVLNTNDYQIDGSVGDTLVSKSLTDPSFADTCITKCQISARTSDDTKMTWFVTNNGVDWEYTELDTIHVFSTVEIPVVFPVPNWFNYGEWVVGSISGKRGIVKGVELLKVFLSDETGSNDWIVGETLTGEDTGYTATISGSVTQRDSNIDLRVMALFLDDASIYDYGILYEVDTEKDETSINNELNIETLFADIYETPIQTNDGLRSYPFSDTTAIVVLNIVQRNDTIAKAISRLDNINGISEFTDQDETPSVSSNHRTYTTNAVSGAHDITDFINSYDGQEITVVNIGSNTVTVKHQGNLHLLSGGDCALGQYDSITLVYISSTIGWVEKNRSNNS